MRFHLFKHLSGGPRALMGTHAPRRCVGVPGRHARQRPTRPCPRGFPDGSQRRSQRRAEAGGVALPRGRTARPWARGPRGAFGGEGGLGSVAISHGQVCPRLLCQRAPRPGPQLEAGVRLREGPRPSRDGVFGSVIRPTENRAEVRAVLSEGQVGCGGRWCRAGTALKSALWVGDLDSGAGLRSMVRG